MSIKQDKLIKQFPRSINWWTLLCFLYSYLMNKVKLKLIFVILTLLCPPALALDWQGYGNMSSSNLTQIWGYVNSKASAAVSGYTTSRGQSLVQFTTNFSNYLNELWHPAWNVIVFYENPYDAILYGYAFRDHWMWYNNYQVSGKRFNFVIWKDYNCDKWETLSVTSGFSDSEKSQISQTFSSIGNDTVNDIWGSAKKVMNNLVAQSNFSGDKAFSLVMTQMGISGIIISGRFCSLQGRFDNSYFNYNNTLRWGSYLLFQTR